MKILMVFIFSIVTSGQNYGAPLPIDMEEINFSGELVNVVKPKNDGILPSDKKVSLRKLYKVGGVIVGCSSEDGGLFFKEAPIATEAEIKSCKNIEELEKRLGLPVSNNYLSTSWSLGDELHDLKFWRICRLSHMGTLMSKLHP
jgi:hypothetical protein